MSFSRNKTTLVLIHGIATAVLVKQPVPLRVLCLANTALTLYCNNKKDTLDAIAVSKISSFALGMCLSFYIKKHKQPIIALTYISTCLALDKMN